MNLAFKDKRGKWNLHSVYRTGLVFSYNSFIKPKFRGRGLGAQEHRKRLKIARDLGYNCIICTVNSSNTTEKRILRNNGWIKVHEFVNEVKHEIEIWVKNL